MVQEHVREEAMLSPSGPELQAWGQAMLEEQKASYYLEGASSVGVDENAGQSYDLDRYFCYRSLADRQPSQRMLGIIQEALLPPLNDMADRLQNLTYRLEALHEQKNLLTACLEIQNELLHKFADHV